jgi:gliding motility-associated-like protein
MKNILLIFSFLVAVFSFSQQNTATFNFTGQPQQFVVPPCVFEVCATVRGAKGSTDLTTGSLGATVTACIPVTPGETLNLYVGGMGTAGNVLGVAGNISWGWNGGGMGHQSNNNVVAHHSHGGGGASDIRQGGIALANRVIVAAGGGGAGGGSTTANAGGNGGCTTGLAGGNTFGAGGGAATQTAGGNGGAPWAGTAPGGFAGTLGIGGNGGWWQTASGGGGGGGRFGGGGGGNDGCCTGANGGGGGGGGSSLVPTGGTCVAGNHNNHGQIVLNWVGGGGVINQPMTISSTSPYCAGSDISLFASNSTAAFYNWFGPNGFTSSIQNPTIPGGVVNSAYTGTYFLHYEDNGCEDTLEIQVVVHDPVLPEFTPYQSYCQDAVIPALPTNALNNSPLTNNPVTGTWSPAINNQQTTTYLFSPNANQCALTSTMQITIIPNIVPQFTQLGPFCINSQLEPLPTTSLDNITGTWSPAINNQDTTTYTFTPNPGECAFSTQMTINIWPLVQPTFNQVAAICQDDNLNQLPTVSLPTILGGISGVWSPAMNNQATTTYTFTPNPNQCALNTQMTIQVLPRPLPTFTMDQTVGCSPLQVFFENTTGFSNPTSCQWNMGNGNIINSCGMFVSSTYTSPGCYDVNLTMTYPGNCVNSYTAIQAICVESDPVAAFSANPTQVEINQQVSFTNLSTGAVDYDWTFGDFSGTFNAANPTHIYESPGFYLVYLVAYTDFGCSDTVSQSILVEEPIIYYVPNSFTPDDDQFNQFFIPIITQGIDIHDYQLLIFNRWGEVLFESNDAKFGWNGTYGGKIVQDGTYIWKLRFKHINKDKREEIYGFVNLIK